MENLALDPTFWNGKRVLVTGHTGFKGGWLCVWLNRLGAKVSGYALPAETHPSLFDAANVADTLHSEIGDVRDLERLQNFVADLQPEVILHMAAQALVRRSYADPVDNFSSNVMGTVHILEAARHCASVRAIVNVTTDKCYENLERQAGYREDEPLGGHDPYSSSKACSELVTASYRRSFDLPLASARAGNVIGGGDWAEDRLIPDLMRSLMAGEPATIRNPASIRPWQHVLEPLHGYLLLAQRLHANPDDFSSAWNFGPDDEDSKPVEWLATRITELWGNDAGWTNTGEADQPHEAQFLRLNCDKAKAQLGWKPELSIAEALKWSVDWYQCYHAGGDVRTMTETQINNYSKGQFDS